MALYPINADGSAAAAQRIAALEADSFANIDSFFAEELARYGIATQRPLRITVQPPLATRPPAPPKHANALQVVWWSLQLRGWAWRQPQAVPRPNVRLFVNYWGTGHTVPDSHGLEKGLIGVAHVYADAAMQRSNAVVIAHELLHTLGASDKYAPHNLEPLFPQGYAEAEAEPLLPQRWCEVMAGRIAQAQGPAVQARALTQCRIGTLTAREIGLLRERD